MDGWIVHFHVSKYLSKSFCLETSSTHANKNIGNYRVSSDISGYTLRYFADTRYRLKEEYNITGELQCGVWWCLMYDCCSIM